MNILGYFFWKISKIIMLKIFKIFTLIHLNRPKNHIWSTWNSFLYAKLFIFEFSGGNVCNEPLCFKLDRLLNRIKESDTVLISYPCEHIGLNKVVRGFFSGNNSVPCPDSRNCLLPCTTQFEVLNLFKSCFGPDRSGGRWIRSLIAFLSVAYLFSDVSLILFLF